VAISIRRATIADAAMLADLGARTFYDTFAADNRPEDMALHLTRSYGVAQQSAELQSSDMVTLLAEVGNEAVGFAQLRDGAAPSWVTGRRPLELWRFYVIHAWHGRGVAAALMNAVVGEAERRQAGTLWLSVWERNPRARAFYGKFRFTDVGTQIFHVGHDAQTDRILVRTLASPGSPTGRSEDSS
jgi:GNAT superfamily N-acetyltransferase